MFRLESATVVLRAANLWKAFLIGANLSGADLSKVVLGDANLIGANLSGANLKGITGIAIEQLEKEALSLKDAIMPDGDAIPSFV